mmetsp:Transcript_5277/g.7938  ORF Transcript_5277/g.7938 Transcript_5277/m.7938 type:complete len:528 (-) Transcript_5277:219-1802(-)
MSSTDQIINQKVTNSYGDQAAADRCLIAATSSLDFDIAELWTYVPDPTSESKNDYAPVKPSCICVYAQPATQEAYRAQLIGIWNKGEKKIHIYSPGLCDRIYKSQSPLWFTSSDKDSPLPQNIHLKTVVALPLNIEIMKNDYCAVFFSTKDIPKNRSSIDFLTLTSKAAILALSDTLNDPPSEIREKSNREMSSVINEVEVLVHLSEKVRTDVNWGSLKSVELLTHGTLCSVYTGIFEDQACVVKTLRKDVPNATSVRREMEEEMLLLSRLQHESIVKIYGAGKVPEIFIICERLDGGSLAQRLGRTTSIRDNRKRFKKREAFGYLDLLRYARQIANGLRYLHDEAMPGKMVIHRDLKPDNIGFTKDNDAKLLDLGLAKCVPKSQDQDATYEMTGATGSVRYMAPEVAESRPYNEKVDVHSYSIVLWEMKSMRKPYEGLHRDQFLSQVVRGHARPQINRRWPKDFSELLKMCWEEDYRNRPSFAEICNRLEQMLQDIPLENNSQKGKRPGDSILRKFGIKDRSSAWF